MVEYVSLTPIHSYNINKKNYSCNVNKRRFCLTTMLLLIFFYYTTLRNNLRNIKIINGVLVIFSWARDAETTNCNFPLFITGTIPFFHDETSIASSMSSVPIFNEKN